MSRVRRDTKCDVGTTSRKKSKSVGKKVKV